MDFLRCHLLWMHLCELNISSSLFAWWVQHSKPTKNWWLRCSTHKGAFKINDFLRNPHFIFISLRYYRVLNRRLFTGGFFSDFFPIFIAYLGQLFTTEIPLHLNLSLDFSPLKMLWVLEGRTQSKLRPPHPVLLRTFGALPRGTPRSIESTPTCPDPWNVRVPPRGPRGGTSGLVLMKSRPTHPAFSGTFRALPQGTPRSKESTPTCPDPRGGAGPRSGHTNSN